MIYCAIYSIQVIYEILFIVTVNSGPKYLEYLIYYMNNESLNYMQLNI